jgi:hypothetical protein
VTALFEQTLSRDDRADGGGGARDLYPDLSTTT